MPAVLAWVDPTASPPSGNAPAPLTGSTVVQTKAGGVNLATDATARVGIGTTSPAQKLDVTGSINTSNNITAAGTLVASGNQSGVDTGGISTGCLSFSLSASYGDLPGGAQCVPGTNPLDVAVNIPTGAKVYATWTYTMRTASQALSVPSQILDNGAGAVSAACTASILTTGENRSCTGFYLWTGLPAGAHTFKVQVNGGIASTVTLLSTRLVVVVLP